MRPEYCLISTCFILFFTILSFSQSVIWEENFSVYPDQTVIGMYNKWTVTTTPDVNGPSIDDHFWVVSNVFETQDINGNGQISDDKVIALSFNASGNHTYSLEIAELEHVNNYQEIYLRDNQENITWDLRQGPYNFSALEGKDYDRFDIIFRSEESPSGNELALNEGPINIKNIGEKLYVKGLTEQVTSKTLTNMLGQNIKTFSNPGNLVLENGLYLGDISSRVYLVHLHTENNLVINKKIILK